MWDNITALGIVWNKENIVRNVVYEKKASSSVVDLFRCLESIMDIKGLA